MNEIQTNPQYVQTFGLEPLQDPNPPQNPNPFHQNVFLMLQSQMRTSILYLDDTAERLCFAHPSDLASIQACPVILTSTIIRPSETFTEITRPYPPAEHGTAAEVITANGERYLLTLSALPPEAQLRQKQIGQLLDQLSAQPFPAPKEQQDMQIITACPEELSTMIQHLAQDYYASYKRAQEYKPRQSLPTLTSNHYTLLPSSNGFRALEQSFGPGLLQPSLWNSETAEEQHMTTPNGSLLRIKGQEDYECKALYNYINGMMGTEGLKHLLILLDTLYLQTGGRTRLVDVHVSTRQLLMRMGYSETQADDLNERRKLVHTILYLARTWVTSSEVRFEEEPRGPGKKRRRGIEYTPLLVIEKIKSSPDGGLDVPDEVKFHLGEDFYNNLFGEHPQYFSLPTAAALGYHAQREKQELCLLFYLCNMISLNHPKGARLSFHTLLLQSGLQTETEIAHGHDRTRDALQVIYALEHLELDGHIERFPHHDVDLVLATEYFTDKCFTGKNKEKNRLAPETVKRLTGQYPYIQELTPQETQEKKRVALQRLLRKEEAVTPPLEFKAGRLLFEKAQVLAERKAQALEKNERVQAARIAKSVKSVQRKRSLKKKEEAE